MTSHTKATVEPPAAALPWRPWRPADAAFMVASLVALAAGAFPEMFLPAHVVDRLACPPALQILLAAQAGLLIMFCPLIIARRAERRAFLPGLLTEAGEFLTLLIAGAPLYLVGAWLSDATALDVIRGVLYLAGVGVAAWGLGLWASAARAAILSAVALVGAAALAAPVVYYLVAEVSPAGTRLGWLWSAGPVTCAFSVAAARGQQWHPAPLWAWALWPGVGAALACGRLLLPANTLDG
jgi:hypothetical protein